MTRACVAECMLLPDHGRFLLCEFIPDDDTAGVREEVWFAIAIDVDQSTSLHVPGEIDFMFGPGFGGVSPRILDPSGALSEEIAGHDVGPAIAVHIHG